MINRENWLTGLYVPDFALPSFDEALLRRRELLEGAALIAGAAATRGEVIVAEATHMRLPLDEPRLRAIGLTGLRASEIVDSVKTNVSRSVSQVLTACDRLKQTSHQAAQQPDIVLAGMISAEWAHLDVKRENGKDYFTHPASVAKIIDLAWNLHAPESDNSDRLARLLFGAYNHDAFEDSLPSNKNQSFISSQAFLVSPLFVQKLFEEAGRNDGEDAAQTLLALTKTRSDSDESALQQYIDGIAEDSDAIIVKLADIQHNHALDPKGLKDIDKASIRKNSKRGRKYEYMQYRLLSALEEHSGLDIWVGHTISALNANRFYAARPSFTDIRPRYLIGRPSS